MNILKKSLLVLAGAATLAVAGTASAMTPPYAMCIYKGESTLSAGGTDVTCWTTLVAKVNCDGDVEIVAVGAVPNDGPTGDPNCYGIGTADLPWRTTAAGIIAGGTINTDGSGGGLVSVINAVTGSPIAAGILNGVGPTGSTAVVCDSTTSPATMVTVPTDVPVNGAFSTGATFVTTTTLGFKGCIPVP